MRGIILSLLSSFALAQTSVILSPAPVFSSVKTNGSPNANGCVFTYISGTTTPLTTYTDYTGTTQNANPVVLSAAGTAQIWIQTGTAYSFTVKTFGGINCASGSTLYSVRGISGGTSQLVTTVPFSSTPTFTVVAQNQLFEYTLTGDSVALPLVVTGIAPPATITFQIIQDNIGGHAFTWPANVSGGAPINTSANGITTQQFIWNGTTTTALGAAEIGAGPSLSAATLTLSNTLVSPTATFSGNVQANGHTIVLPNSAVGTVLNEIACMDNSGKVQSGCAVFGFGLVGIVIAGAGNTGSATIQTDGLVSCVFDGSVTAGYQVYISTTPGQCHAQIPNANNGPSYDGVLLGYVLASGGSGLNQMVLVHQSINNIIYYGFNGGIMSPQKIVVYSGQLSSGTDTINFLGRGQFVDNPICISQNIDNPNPIKSVFSGNVLTSTGTGSDHYQGICMGDGQ